MRRRAMRWLLAAVALVAAGPVLAQGKEAHVVQIEAGKSHIDFKVGNELVARYHIDEKVAKPFFHPLNAPEGLAVTRGWPITKGEPGETTDHVHQKSVWFCHGDVIPEGVEVKHKIKGITGVDFWSEHQGHGKIVCVDVGTPKLKGTHGQVTTRNEWRTADGQKILDETRTIHLHALPNAYLLVLDIDLQASVCPITFGDTKEGSMGVRVRDSMAEKQGGGKLTNAEGKTGEKAIWGMKSLWCDYSGPVSAGAEDRKATAGIAVFDDPKNPHPACWHSRAYGLHAANPFGRKGSGFPAMKEKTDLVKLSKGQNLKLRYGVLAHTGDVESGKVAEHFKTFTQAKD